MRSAISNVVVLALVAVSCSSGEMDGAGMLPPGDPGVAGSVAVPSQPTAGASAPSPLGPVAGAAPSVPGTPGTGTPGAAGAAATAGAGGDDMPPGTGDLPPATGGPISEACRGFAFEGLVYSPGGDVLPNACEDFHATLNNPYAVRCVDAWPWFATEFPGDVYCILPPAPGMGIQLGHHPQGEGDAWFDAVSTGDMSGYERANIGTGWILQPGDEEERNILIKHTNEGGNFQRVYTRMRGGSHHMIASTSTDTNTFVWAPGGPDGLLGGGSSVPGSQRPDENNPQSRTIPAEDVGLYGVMAANVTVNYNMHHFNPTESVILKEAWQNLWWTDNPSRRVNGVSGLPFEQVLATFAQPGQIVDMHYATTAPGKMRVIKLFGHRHAWTTNFSAWVERSGSTEPEIIYQSFDWFDEPTYLYNSEVMNPVPSHETRTDGAKSGILELDAGDELHFNCHIEYTEERATEESSPVTPAQNGPLRFANAAFTAEMCILFGSAEGSNGSPVKQGAPPDFASAR